MMPRARRRQELSGAQRSCLGSAMALLFLSLCFALARWHRSAGVVGLPKQNDHVASASHVDRAAAMAGVRNATLNESKPRVAVCVTGMLERLQPRSLVENLF